VGLEDHLGSVRLFLQRAVKHYEGASLTGVSDGEVGNGGGCGKGGGGVLEREASATFKAVRIFVSLSPVLYGGVLNNE